MITNYDFLIEFIKNVTHYGVSIVLVLMSLTARMRAWLTENSRCTDARAVLIANANIYHMLEKSYLVLAKIYFILLIISNGKH